MYKKSPDKGMITCTGTFIFKSANYFLIALASSFLCFRMIKS
jgi:hypothetical protein